MNEIGLTRWQDVVLNERAGVVLADVLKRKETIAKEKREDEGQDHLQE